MASAELLTEQSHKPDRKALLKEKVLKYTSAEKGIPIVRLEKTREVDRPWKQHLSSSKIKPRRLKKDDKEEKKAVVEVMGLLEPRGIPSARKKGDSGGGVTVRIHENRRQRHDATLKDMKKELASISAAMEPRIHSASELLVKQLSENNKVIKAFFEKIEPREVLEVSTLPELVAVWKGIQDQTPLRLQLVQKLDKTLMEIEADRSEMVTEVLRCCGKRFQEIAFLLPVDVDRLMEEEAHLINVSITANHRSYTRLCKHLCLVDLNREKLQRQRWEDIVMDWRNIVCKISAHKFLAYMESSAVRQPVEVEKVHVYLKAKQSAINKRREELLTAISYGRPPAANRSKVYEWKENFLSLHEKLERVHSEYLLQLKTCQDAVLSACESEMERHKAELISIGACDGSSTVYEVMNKQFIPLVEQQSCRMAEQLQAIEHSLDSMLSVQKSQFLSIFQFATEAAYIWDTHVAAMDDSSRKHHALLQHCRADHDSENQNLEAHLDVVLDRLRQGPSQEAINYYLKEAHSMLNKIQEGYTSFHSTLLSTIHSYPPMMQKDLEVYESSLCKFFKVQKQILKSKNRPSKSGLRSRAGSKAEVRKSSQSITSTGGSSLTAIVEEVISSSTGQVFSGDQSTFLTQDEESEGMAITAASEGIVILDEAFSNARDGFRASFLDHLECWKVEVLQKSREVVAGKVEEACTELDMRMHLHKPRPDRVEQDIHYVRSVELVAHQDRVRRHSKGLVAALKLEKSNVHMLEEKLQEKLEVFSQQLADLEGKLGSITKMSRLVKIEAESLKLLEKHQLVVEKGRGDHLHAAEEAMEALDSSNTRYKDSLKQFSEGGNYCLEEIEQFSKKLDKLSGKITAAWSFITGEVERVTKEHQSQVEEIMAKFRSQYMLCYTDVSFLEATARVMTSTQVHIKTEVSTSNAMAGRLSASLDRLKGILKNCESKDERPSALLSELPSLYEACAGRMDYLYCSVRQNRGTRVGFHHREASLTNLMHSEKPSSKPLTPAAQQQQQTISAISVTRKILEHASLKKSGADTKSTSVMSGSFKGAGIQEDTSRKTKLGRKKQAAIERKHVNFGIGGGEDGTSLFLPKIRSILQKTHEELYQMTESFYKQKGSRILTQLEMHEDFVACMDAFIERCQSYRKQAEEYRNDCIEEFHCQLDSLMAVMERIPGLVFAELREEVQERCCALRTQVLSTHSQEESKDSKEKSELERNLRPTVGHPSHKSELEALCSREGERHQSALERISNHSTVLKENEQAHLRQFVEELVKNSASLVELFDSVICSSEVVPGSDKLRVKPPLEQLMREHINPDRSKTDEAKGACPGTTGTVITWPELPTLSELLQAMGGHHDQGPEGLGGVGSQPVPPPAPPPPSSRAAGHARNSGASSTSSSRSTREASTGKRQQSLQSPAAMAVVSMSSSKKMKKLRALVSRKSSPAHQAVIRSRDLTLQEYSKVYKLLLEDFSATEDKARTTEDRWHAKWNTSVERIKSLYH